MVYKTDISAFRKFRTEWNRIKRIYLVTIFSYGETIERIEEEVKSKEIGLGEEFIYNGEVLARSPRELTKNLSNRYATMLGESLFVRLISIMELYFSDVLNELSKLTFDPFKTQDSKEFKVAELLSLDDISEIQNKIIKNKIRGIVLGGFPTINKFFKNKLQIDFNNSNLDLTVIEELYSRRNLLVHAGGIIDDIYANIYGGTKGRSLKVEEEYFLNSLTNIFDLIVFINTNLETKHDFSLLKVKKVKAQNTDNIPIPKSNRIGKASFNAVFKTTTSLNRFLDEEFVFGFQQKYKLKEILLNKTVTNELEAFWDIEGDATITGTYIGFMKLMNKKGLFDSYKVLSKSYEKVTN